MASENPILLYETADGETRLEALYQDESVWLSQRDMAALFQVTTQNIGLHISNIYETSELQPDPTRKYFLQVRREGSRNVSRNVMHYNLDMIISVGYRVNSDRGAGLNHRGHREHRDNHRGHEGT